MEQRIEKTSEEEIKGFFITRTDKYGSRETSVYWPKIFKTFIPIILGIILLIVLWPINFIGRDERGVRIMAGAVVSDTLQPGVAFHAPLIGEIRTISIRPRIIPVQIEVGDGGAISKDNQIIGMNGTVIWKYSETDVPRIFKEFPTESGLTDIIQRNVTQAIKTTLGNYSIYDVAMNQAKIASEIEANLKRTVASYPVDIIQSTVENFNWSQEFDRRINATMEATQQVKEAEQKANIAEQENRRLSIEAQAQAQADIAKAEGRKRTAELDAEAAILKANGEREAAILEAQGIAESNRLIAQNLQVQIRLRELDIPLERAKKWNGVEVPQYIPLTPAGCIVTLPGVK
jgi:regulator of protease activity HflC (stomatin/prohibitin superfamily)